MNISTSIKRAVLTGLFFVLLFSGTLPAWFFSKSAPAPADPNGFVYLLCMGIDGDAITYKGLRNGFAVGDGRYVVTAAHCMDGFVHTHDSLFVPLVISPYYGDLFEAEVVAIDRENDLAVLQPAWEGHPALELERASGWREGKEVRLVAYPPPAPCRGGNGEISRSVLSETVPLKCTQGQGCYQVRVGPVKYPGPGWSGSPFLNPKTGCVVGVLSREHYRKELLFFSNHYIFGGSVDSIRRLFLEQGLACGKTGRFPLKPGGRERFERVLDVLDAMISGREAEAGNLVKMLCREVPESAMMHLLAGWVLPPPENKAFYAKAAAAPESSLVRSAYAHWLSRNGQLQQAARQFRTVTEQDPNCLFAQYGQLSVLADTDPNAAEVQVIECIRLYPESAALHFLYSKILRGLDRRKEELPQIRKAVALSKEVPYLYQRYLADSLKANQRYEEAQTAYQELLKMHECERCWRAYASLLQMMGGEQKEAAKRAMEKAKTFHADPNRVISDGSGL